MPKESKDDNKSVVGELKKARKIKDEAAKERQIKSILIRIIDEVGHRYPVAFTVIIRTVLSLEEREKFSALLKELGMDDLHELLEKVKKAA